MEIFSKQQQENNVLTIQKIMSEDYQQKYFDECKFIWKNYVPKSGQADNLQGELLREIEKIRCEAQDNGNINWNDNFSSYCDFISKKLLEQSIFSEAEKEEITLIVSYLKECGNYAQKFSAEQISEEDVDFEKIAYVNDNLYDRICDKIGKLHKHYMEPIPYEK